MAAALEGLVQAQVSPDHKRGVMTEVNCETDFAARNPGFRGFVLETANLIAAAGAESPAEARTLRAADGLSVGEKLADLAAVLGENLVLRRCACWEAGANCAIGAYLHGDYLTEGKVGVLVEAAADRPETIACPGFEGILKDLALQTASLKPAYVRREDMPAKTAARIHAGFLAEALAEGKPAALAKKVARGRLEKYCQGACLLEQPFIKDPGRTVREWLAELWDSSQPIKELPKIRIERRCRLEQVYPLFVADSLAVHRFAGRNRPGGIARVRCLRRFGRRGDLQPSEDERRHGPGLGME